MSLQKASGSASRGGARKGAGSSGERSWAGRKSKQGVASWWQGQSEAAFSLVLKWPWADQALILHWSTQIIHLWVPFKVWARVLCINSTSLNIQWAQCWVLRTSVNSFSGPSPSVYARERSQAWNSHVWWRVPLCLLSIASFSDQHRFSGYLPIKGTVNACIVVNCSILQA